MRRGAAGGVAGSQAPDVPHARAGRMGAATDSERQVPSPVGAGCSLVGGLSEEAGAERNCTRFLSTLYLPSVLPRDGNYTLGKPHTNVTRTRRVYRARRQMRRPEMRRRPRRASKLSTDPSGTATSPPRRAMRSLGEERPHSAGARAGSSLLLEDLPVKRIRALVRIQGALSEPIRRRVTWTATRCRHRWLTWRA